MARGGRRGSRAFLRYLWALPNTMIGFLFVPLAFVSGGRVKPVDGILEVHGRAISWLLKRFVPLAGGAAAITLGHVVIGRNQTDLERCRGHEQVHVRQYERWGPLFLPAYFAAALIARLRGGDAYFDNPFERQAREESDEGELRGSTKTS